MVILWMMFRYGSQVAAEELNSLYGDSRAQGFGSEVIEISKIISNNPGKDLMDAKFKFEKSATISKQ